MIVTFDAVPVSVKYSAHSNNSEICTAFPPLQELNFTGSASSSWLSEHPVHKDPPEFALFLPVQQPRACILALHSLEPCCLCLAPEILGGEEIAQRPITPPVQLLAHLPISSHPEPDRRCHFTCKI